MKIRVMMLVSLVVLIYGSVRVSAQELPCGWIVYSDGEDAIKENLQTHEKINLTSDFDLAVSKPVISQDGKWFAWVSQEQGEEKRVFVRSLPNGEVKKIELSPGDYQNPSISPDEQYLSFEIVRKIGKGFIVLYPLQKKEDIIGLGKGYSSHSTWNFDAEKPILAWVEGTKKKRIGTLTILGVRADLDYKSFSGKDCQNLAWTRDGSLTYESKGIIYLMKGEKIIEGTCPQWTEEGGLLFRGADRSLYYLYQGEERKVLDSVPEWFCYCSGH